MECLRIRVVTQFFLTRLIVYEFLRYAEFLFAENSPNKAADGSKYNSTIAVVSLAAVIHDKDG